MSDPQRSAKRTKRAKCRLCFPCPVAVVSSPIAVAGETLTFLLTYKGGAVPCSATGALCPTLAQVRFPGLAPALPSILVENVPIVDCRVVAVLVPPDAGSGQVTVHVAPECAPLTFSLRVLFPRSCAPRPCSVDSTCMGRLTSLCPVVTMPIIAVSVGMSLQLAINSAPNTGAVIQVGPGVYPSNIIIPATKTNLTLVSTTPGAAILAPPILALGTPVVVVNGATCIRILGFTIVGPSTNAGRRNSDMVIRNGATAIVEGNYLTFDTTFPITGVPGGIGVRVLTGSAALIQNNRVDEYQAAGIGVFDDGTCAVVRGNAINGAGPTAIRTQNGIQLGGGATVSVSGNVVENNFFTGPRSGPDLTFNAAGILLFDSTAPVCIGTSSSDAAAAGNQLLNNNAGIMLDPGAIVNTNALVQGNYTTNNELGLLVGETSCNNVFIQNLATPNAVLDIQDESVGSGSAGTANVYLCNTCTTDNRGGAICRARAPVVEPIPCPPVLVPARLPDLEDPADP